MSRTGEETAEETVRVWLVERTYSDDEQNLIVLTYATPDGRRDYRKERALTSFTGDRRETTAAVDVSPTDLGTVEDPDLRERYAAEVARVRERHDPDDPIRVPPSTTAEGPVPGGRGRLTAVSPSGPPWRSTARPRPPSAPDGSCTTRCRA
jgi:hypothetical protein